MKTSWNIKKVAADAPLKCYERKNKANINQTGIEGKKEITADEMDKAKATQRQWPKQAQKIRKAYLEGNLSSAKFQA